MFAAMDRFAKGRPPPPPPPPPPAAPRYYHPVANYSYPRHDGPSPGALPTPSSRSSSGSEASVPGLIEDRTDSELSLDDDYQHHVHASQAWHSFRHPSTDAAARHKPLTPSHAPYEKAYTGLSPSTPPTRPERRSGPDSRPVSAWPLALLSHSASPVTDRTRKPAASYSPFPRPEILSPPDLPPPTVRPSRPPPPPPLLLPLRPAPSAWAPVAGAPADQPPRRLRTVKSTVAPVQRPMAPPAPRAPRHHRSVAHLASAGPRAAPTAQPEPEPHSVFEYDDSDCDTARSRSFFRFHKRSDSDQRRPPPRTSADGHRRLQRQRALTAPSSPQPLSPNHHHHQPPDPPPRHEPSARKRQGHDVLGRMLGRRAK